MIALLGFDSHWMTLISLMLVLRAVFLNRRAAARYRAVASIVPGCES